MAIDIKSIPVLEDKIALEFIQKADSTFQKKKETVDFSKQVKSAENILSKSKLK